MLAVGDQVRLYSGLFVPSNVLTFEEKEMGSRPLVAQRLYLALRTNSQATMEISPQQEVLEEALRMPVFVQGKGIRTIYEINGETVNFSNPSRLTPEWAEFHRTYFPVGLLERAA